ncbi:hypothetical protein I552_7363 [Mycobacterium xenopi 3993]|nr:hypothetical protein I552_7363 [Mycobacterium xenopi 3993]
MINSAALWPWPRRPPVDVGGDDPVALGGEAERDRFADPRAGAGHQCELGGHVYLGESGFISDEPTFIGRAGSRWQVLSRHGACWLAGRRRAVCAAVLRARTPQPRRRTQRGGRGDDGLAVSERDRGRLAGVGGLATPAALVPTGWPCGCARWGRDAVAQGHRIECGPRFRGGRGVADCGAAARLAGGGRGDVTGSPRRVEGARWRELTTTPGTRPPASGPPQRWWPLPGPWPPSAG